MAVRQSVTLALIAGAREISSQRQLCHQGLPNPAMMLLALIVALTGYGGSQELNGSPDRV